SWVAVCHLRHQCADERTKGSQGTTIHSTGGVGMTRVVKTESGSVYEFDGQMARRVNPDSQKRGDGEWWSMQYPLPDHNLEGGRLFLTLESLSHLGTDDAG